MKFTSYQLLSWVRPFLVRDFFRLKKWTLFAPSVSDFIFELPCTSVESYARLYVKTSNSLFSCYTETTRSTYQVPVPGICSKQQFAAGTPIALLYETGDAVRIDRRPPSPNTCRLCARSSRTLFRLPSERRRHPNAGRARPVESIIVSALH